MQDDHPVMRATRCAVQRLSSVLVGLATISSAAFAHCGPGAPNPVHEQTYVSPEFKVDQIYKSMQGPIGSVTFDLLNARPAPGTGHPPAAMNDHARMNHGSGGVAESAPMIVSAPQPELVWLTGFRSIVVDPQARQLPQHFMCHTNLVYRGLGAHREVFQNGSQVNKDKLFTISQGEEQARFPEGFGIPVISNLAGSSFGVFNQLLNVNYTDFRNPVRLRFENTIYYVREKERTRPMRPLYQALGQVMVATNKPNAIFDIPAPGKTQAGATCSGGDTASPMTFHDQYGQEFSYHWKLYPGREVRSTLITSTMLKLKQDTTIHYIVAHMHPFGESLALKDLTEDRILFESRITNYTDRIGLAHVEHYASEEGIPVYIDHEYALISTYNNTSTEVHDAMAIMYFFLLDPTFQMPDAAALDRARNWRPPAGSHAAMGHM